MQTNDFRSECEELLCRVKEIVKLFLQVGFNEPLSTTSRKG